MDNVVDRMMHVYDHTDKDIEHFDKVIKGILLMASLSLKENEEQTRENH